MKKKLRIKFVDFWPDLNEKNNFFYNLLSKYYTLELSNKPEVLFYSNFGFEHLKYTCKKIFYTGENILPDYNQCDYAFSFDKTNTQNFYLPHFVEYEHFFDFKNGKNTPKILEYQQTEKTKFCSFMASNQNAKERIRFVQKLMKYKKVVCSGPVLYNMEEKEQIGKMHDDEYIDWRKEKLETIKTYKFTIAFENEQSENYVTEKIYQPLLVKSIPIYWGAPNIDDYFNPKSFINVSDYHSYKDVIKAIIQIDQDDELYQRYLNEPAILETSKLYTITEETIYQNIKELIEKDFTPRGKKNIIKNAIIYYLKTIKKKVFS